MRYFMQDVKDINPDPKQPAYRSIDMPSLGDFCVAVFCVFVAVALCRGWIQ